MNMHFKNPETGKAELTEYGKYCRSLGDKYDLIVQKYGEHVIWRSFIYSSYPLPRT